ncbi:MAG: tetratricopeptide (TPR) repeat protein [Crocinitomicaceae bacterium]|jgi:tetratricopeptide (TPR) repeat protein
MKTLLILLSLSIIGTSYCQTAEEYEVKSNDYFLKNDYKNALKAIDNAIELEMTVDYYHAIRAKCLIGLGEIEESLNAYGRGIILFPKSSQLYDERALLYTRLRMNTEAIADYNKALKYAENDTTKFMIMTNRAAAKMAWRDFEGAYDDLMQSYNFDSTDIAVLVNLGAMCDEVGRGDETLKYLLKAVEIDPTFSAPYANIGYKYQEMGRYDEAIKYYNKVLELDPEEPLGFSNRSYNLYKLGEFKSAMKDINKSIEIYPANSYAYKVRALIHIANKKNKKACEDLDIAIELGYTEQYGDEVQQLINANCQ